MSEFNDLALRACTINCHRGPCIDCCIAARRMVLHMMATGLVSFEDGKRLLRGHTGPCESA